MNGEGAEIVREVLDKAPVRGGRPFGSSVPKRAGSEELVYARRPCEGTRGIVCKVCIIMHSFCKFAPERIFM